MSTASNSQVPVIRRTIFASDLVTIRHAAARPARGAHTGCGELQAPDADLLVLPLTGVFARHDSARRHVVATPSHALFFQRHAPYRLSFPDGIGDTVLSFEFAREAQAAQLSHTGADESFRSAALPAQALLEPAAVLARGALARLLGSATPVNALEVEERSLALLDASVRGGLASRKSSLARGLRATKRDHTAARHHDQIEAVKQAIALHPEREWTLGALAQLVHASSFHLARLFREQIGIPVHQYLLRSRLVKSLPAVQEPGADLTAIALDAGFSSHSHFSHSFKNLFGVAPSQLRA
jgi:AraC family transcriptional regulator